MIDEKPEKPYSYVKFLKTKNHNGAVNGPGEPPAANLIREDICYINIDGCHGNVDALAEMEKQGCTIIGCGFGDARGNHSDAKQNKLSPVVNYVRARTRQVERVTAHSAIKQKMEEKNNARPK